MSPDPQLAITVPGQPLIFAAPLVVIVAMLVIIVVQNTREHRKAIAAWRVASEELGLDMFPKGTKHGPIARGVVNSHHVTIATVASKRGKRAIKTQYSVSFRAPDAPQFQLVQRADATGVPILETGSPKFDAVVAIRTQKPKSIRPFFTASRRAAILRLLTYWPTAIISNDSAHLTTIGIENDSDKLIDSICHLVASAETFDRAPEKKSKKKKGAGGSGSSGGRGSAQREENGDSNSNVMVEVRLDEQSVLADLFNSNRDEAGIDSRFADAYQGSVVNWSGEVVRVTEPDESGRQRVAALIGSADGQTAESGRVVALTTIWAENVVTEGDVITFGGILANLDSKQRLFHLV